MVKLALIAALAACDAPPPAADTRPRAVPQKAAAALSNAQSRERSEECGKLSRATFQREWKDAAATPGEAPARVDFTNHYNAKLDACFYLLTVSHSAERFRKLLFEVNEREPYGEYASAVPGSPLTCRVEHLYCGSSGEWDVLAAPYMED
jgi:hypothetical protein